MNARASNSNAIVILPRTEDPACVRLALSIKRAAGTCRLPFRRFPSKLCAALDSSRGLRMDRTSPLSSLITRMARCVTRTDPIDVRHWLTRGARCEQIAGANASDSAGFPDWKLSWAL